MSDKANSKFVALGVACFLATSVVDAAAENFDGTWRGTLSCNKLSFTKGAQ